jgi:hypothetical protein
VAFLLKSSKKRFLLPSRLLSLFAGVLAACLVYGCAERASTIAPAARDDPSRCAGIFSVHLSYSDEKKKSDPSVTVSINGVEGKYVLDTGSSHPLIFSSVLSAAGVQATPGYNRSSLPISFEAHEIVFGEFFSVDPIIPLKDDGYSGILSIPKISDKGPVAMDFQRNWLIVDLSGSGDYVRLAKCSNIDLAGAVELRWEARDLGVVATRVDLLGKKSVVLNVDTGSSMTTVESDLVREISSREPGPEIMNIQGARKRGEIIPNADLDLAGRHVNVKSLVVLNDTQTLPNGLHWQGKLGMDVLSDFNLILPSHGDDRIILVPNSSFEVETHH